MKVFPPLTLTLSHSLAICSYSRIGYYVPLERYTKLYNYTILDTILE